MNIFGYTVLSIVFNTVIYPFCAHWGFSEEGWLFEMGYHDFAGSGTIHAMAGVGALVTTIALGPRKNRFKPEDAEMFEPNNPTYIALSTLSVNYILNSKSIALDLLDFFQCWKFTWNQCRRKECRIWHSSNEYNDFW